MISASPDIRFLIVHIHKLEYGSEFEIISASFFFDPLYACTKIFLLSCYCLFFGCVR